MPKRGRRRKKNRTQQVDSENPAGALTEEIKVAKSLVVSFFIISLNTVLILVLPYYIVLMMPLLASLSFFTHNFCR